MPCSMPSAVCVISIMRAICSGGGTPRLTPLGRPVVPDEYGIDPRTWRATNTASRKATSLRSMTATTSPSPTPSAASALTPRSARSVIAAPSRSPPDQMTLATIVLPEFWLKPIGRKEEGLAREPLGDALERIRPRGRIRADMHAPGAAVDQNAVALLQRQLGAVEIMVSAG